MLFAATLTTALAVASNVVLFSLANPMTTDVIYKNITLTINNYSITVGSPCQPLFTPCVAYCNNELQEGNTIDDDCATDCEDDTCRFGEVQNVEYPPGSGTFITFATFAQMSSDARVAEIYQRHGRQVDSACQVCQNLEQAAALCGRQRHYCSIGTQIDLRCNLRYPRSIRCGIVSKP
jgi:hypothetical protein